MYGSNVNDKKWEIINPYVEGKKLGRPCTIEQRQIIDVIFYQSKMAVSGICYQRIFQAINSGTIIINGFIMGLRREYTMS